MFKVLNKKILTSFLVIVLVVLLGLFVVPQFNKGFSQGSITTTSVQNLPGQVIVAGSVSSESIANLSFLTAGKLTYLPLQEGSQIKKGQVVAAVDPTQAQQDVTSAQAEVQSAQAALNKVLDDIHLFQYGNGGFANVGSANETQTQKTQRQQAEAALNVAQDNLRKAQNVLQNTSLVSPISGVLVKEDMQTSGVNINPANSFVIADLNHLVFKAQVPNYQIGYLAEGKQVKIKLDSSNDQIDGTVEKIYPDQITLLSGGKGYIVDITSSDLINISHFGDTGSVLIPHQNNQTVVVPSYLILDNQYIWVLKNNTPQLVQVKLGDSYDGQVEVTQGLTKDDLLITNPPDLIKNLYPFI